MREERGVSVVEEEEWNIRWRGRRGTEGEGRGAGRRGGEQLTIGALDDVSWNIACWEGSE